MKNPQSARSANDDKKRITLIMNNSNKLFNITRVANFLYYPNYCNALQDAFDDNKLLKIQLKRK